jgi:exonuclease SbcC
MKILAIRLKNLASLAGPIEVDFTAEPLASTGLFAITGPTGAGKSTLLDALCLALFGSVPRLGNLKRETKVPDVDSDIGSDDPRTLLRRGTGSGFAEVDFVGIDGRRYRARWEANRARDKANGKLQNSKQSLYDIDAEQVLTSQKREYELLIEARLGLNFEQFTRAVMLAQSEFSAFLKADDKDRSELLEKLTNTAIYSQLGRRAFVKAREAQDAHRQLESEAVGVQPLSEDERSVLDQQFSEAQQLLEQQRGQLKQLDQQRQWLAEYLRLQTQVSDAVAQQQLAHQQWQALAGERVDLNLLEQLAPQRHLFARRQALQAQLTPLAEQLQQRRERQSVLSHEQAQLRSAAELAREAVSAAQTQHTESAPLLRQAFEAERDLSRLQQEADSLHTATAASGEQHDAGRKSLGHLLERQQLSASTLQRLQGELEKSVELAPLAEAWSAWRDRLQAFVQVHNRVAQGSAEMTQLQARAQSTGEALAAQRNTLEVLYREADTEPDAVAEQVQILASLLQENRKQQRGFEALSRIWTSLQELDRRATALQEEQATAQQQREQLTREGLQTRDALQVAEQTLSVTRALLERQRLARGASVETLREHLHNDEPCPVCGSTEHPWHQPEALLQDMAVHDEQEGAIAQQAVDALKEKVVELRERVASVIARQKDLLQQQERLHQERSALMPSLETHSLGAALLDRDPAQRDAWLSQQLSHLEQNIRQDEGRQNALLTLQQEAAQLQQELRATTQASEAASQQLAEQQSQLNNDQRRLDEERQRFAALLPATWMARLAADAANTFMQLDVQVAARLASTAQHQDEHNEQAERQQLIERQQLQQHNTEAQLQALQTRLAEHNEQLQAVRQRLQQLLAEHPSAEQWQQHQQATLDQARNTQAETEQQVQDSGRQLLQLATELKGGEERLQAVTAESDGLAGDIEQWRARHSELDDDGVARLLSVDEAQLHELRQRLQASDKAIEQSQVLLAERQQRLQAHAQAGQIADASASAETHGEQLEQALTQLQAAVHTSEQHSAELRARQVDDQRRRDANQALAQRIALAYGEYQRWGRISALIGSASGDTFRKIAQAYNLDLLVHHANVQLRQLVRRYRLKRGGSMLGLLVMDTEMGDELRSVHSLSGGETFLVSLALALGLASMASSTLKIESLFIDEGFGSLDPESLQLAMDALDGLQAQGRKVGVISHVQEMHERIPVQIRVVRQGNGLSTVEVG